MTHHELCLLAAQWLHEPYNTKIKKYKILDDRDIIHKIPACKWVAVEMTYQGGACIPDVFGWGDGLGAGVYGVNIEVKMSHSDFMADFKKSYNDNLFLDLGYIKYYCCPKGIIKPNELPEYIGLLYEDNGTIEVVRIADNRKNKQPSREVPFIASVMRRIGVKPQIFSFKKE